MPSLTWLLINIALYVFPVFHQVRASNPLGATLLPVIFPWNFLSSSTKVFCSGLKQSQKPTRHVRFWDDVGYIYYGHTHGDVPAKAGLITHLA